MSRGVPHWKLGGVGTERVPMPDQVPKRSSGYDRTVMVRAGGVSRPGCAMVPTSRREQIQGGSAELPAACFPLWGGVQRVRSSLYPESVATKICATYA
jgi:hypothetical protein